jgi:hypothetical protein
MFDYMTELDKVDIQPGVESEIDVSGAFANKAPTMSPSDRYLLFGN